MRLAEFILAHMPEILQEWDAFARTLDTSGELSAHALRDHAKPILEAVAHDMATPETPREQFNKSRGLEPVDLDSAASTHGTLRHVSGFSLIQLTAEYRALRATVLRLWLPKVTTFDADVATDMVRFNETIDQALAESVLTFSDQGKRSRDTFLAILGHDLRSPLAAISLAGDVLVRQQPAPEEIKQIGVRLRRSASTMRTMVNDLLEFARLQLGGLIPIAATMMDISPACNDAVEDARAAHPDCNFKLTLAGDLSCNADAARLQQLFSNLLNNAAQYSSPGEEVELIATGSNDAVIVQVCNLGSVIPEAAIGSIFEALVQLDTDSNDRGRPSTSVGLGLYIAREITLAHGGSIEVSSSQEAGTVFTVRLAKLLTGQELGRMHNAGI
ncbi:HAMP domain-containing sensor histidine kinase [soil metagenome]